MIYLFGRNLHARLLFFLALFFVFSTDVLGAADFIIKLRLEGDSLPNTIRLEDRGGVSEISHNTGEQLYVVRRRVPAYGQPPSQFAVVIPWQESTHHLFFRLTSTREGGMFSIAARLRRLPLTLSSVRQLEQMNAGLQNNIERYLWSRDLFKRAELALAQNHSVTLGALRQWFDAAYSLVEAQYNVFAFDEEVQQSVLRYRSSLGDEEIFRRINRRGYLDGLMKQAQVAIWQDLAKVPELTREGRFQDAYDLNEHYRALWERQDPKSKQLVTRYHGVTSALLEENHAYLANLKRGPA